MLNLYSDPEGKRIFDKSNPATAHHPTSSAGDSNQNGSDAEEVLREKDRRISELERELTLIKVRRKGTQLSIAPKMERSCVQDRVI